MSSTVLFTLPMIIVSVAPPHLYSFITRKGIFALCFPFLVLSQSLAFIYDVSKKADSCHMSLEPTLLLLLAVSCYLFVLKGNKWLIYILNI